MIIGLIFFATSKAISYATKLCENLSQLGFKNRGVKFKKFYEMNYANAPNIIFQFCFCDSKRDIKAYNKYSWERLAYRFCNSIESNILIERQEEGKGYVIKLFTDIVTCFIKGNSKDVWMENNSYP